MYEGFLIKEGDRAAKVLEIVSSTDRLAVVRASMQFVVDTCPPILDLLTWCDFSSLPFSLQIYVSNAKHKNKTVCPYLLSLYQPSRQIA